MDYPLRATDEERKQFEEQGFFVRESVFSGDEIEALRAGVENIHRQVLEAAAQADAPAGELIDNQRFQDLLGSTVKWEWDDELQAVRSMEPMAHLDSRIDAVVDDPRLWGPCRDLIGHEKLSLFSDKLNVKRPGGAPFPYHQEGPYWEHGAEDLEHTVSTLTYLDDANRENGCFWVIPRTHNKGNLKGLEGRGVLGGLYTDVSQLDEEGYAFEAPAGSVMFFHYNIVHGSQTNRSQSSRRAVVNAYQPAGLREWRVDVRRDIKQDIDESR